MPPKPKTAKDVILTPRNPYSELTILQKRYVEARMQGLTKTAAARAAGCAESTVGQLEGSPKVRAAIRYIIKESTASVDELTKTDVLTGMMDAVNAAATASELVMAWREIGKLLGVYEPERRVLEVKDYSKDELKELSDKDLLGMAGGRMAEAIDVDEADYQEI